MSNVIVIAGKGGTGKTTVAALLTLFLARRKSGSVLAVDADPNSNLADALAGHRLAENTKFTLQIANASGAVIVLDRTMPAYIYQTMNFH